MKDKNKNKNYKLIEKGGKLKEEIKVFEYKAIQFRKDGSKVKNKYPWKLTKKEYEFYKKEMPRRQKIGGWGNIYKFEKLPKKEVGHFLPI